MATKTLTLDPLFPDGTPAVGTRLSVSVDRDVAIKGAGVVAKKNAARSYTVGRDGTFPTIDVVPNDDASLQDWSKGYALIIEAEPTPLGGITGGPWPVVVTSAQASSIRMSDLEVAQPVPSEFTTIGAFMTQLEGIQAAADAAAADAHSVVDALGGPDSVQRVIDAADNAEAARDEAAQSAQAAAASAALVGAPADTAIAAAIDGAASQTNAALDRLAKAKALAVDARRYGVKADGVTDDAAAWNALVASMPFGTTITWRGNSVLKSPIKWKSGISLIGQGWGTSKLSTIDTTGSNYFSAIQTLTPDVSATSPITDCQFAYFEVDGSGLSGATADIAGKAIFMQWLRRCDFLYLYLHDTIGTALGTDFMPECLIHGVVAERAGRNWTGVEGGNAGIGIGSGQWPIEDVTISNCHTINCGHFGIFLEKQTEAQFAYRSEGAKIIGCSTIGTKGSGIADLGNTGTIIANNYVQGNGTLNNASWRDGIGVHLGAVRTMISGNYIVGNAGDGISIKAANSPNNVYIAGNHVGNNTRRGIYFEPGIDREGTTITGNVVWANGYTGIDVLAGGGKTNKNLIVTNNRCYNNGQNGLAGQGKGINVEFGATTAVISGNICYDNQTTKTQEYGLSFPYGTFIDTVVTGNAFGAHKNAPVTTAGSTQTSVTWGPNAGILTSKSGTGSFSADGILSTTVYHGGTKTPSNITLTALSGDQLWVSSQTATSFNVTRATGTGAPSFQWRATWDTP